MSVAPQLVVFQHIPLNSASPAQLRNQGPNIGGGGGWGEAATSPWQSKESFFPEVGPIKIRFLGFFKFLPILFFLNITINIDVCVCVYSYIYREQNR